VKDKNKKYANKVVVCGARCIFKDDGKCTWYMKGVAAVIGVDGRCVMFEPAAEK